LPIFQNEAPFEDRELVHTNGWYSFQKCQADIIKACKSLKLPVLTAGRVGADRGAHFNYCLSLKYGTVLEDTTKLQLNRIYNKSRVYVVPSLFEIHSTSMCEALACGCQVVSSSHHLANNEYQGLFIFRWGDFDDLKDKILQAYYCTNHQDHPRVSPADLAQVYQRLFSNKIKMI
jgi:glycosyltransferase involved in cell wall biosynthesis